jgi:DNA invertase Pin-like site-specific DNA recombinase
VASDGILFGYARVSTDDQKLDLQLDALAKAGVQPTRIYSDHASGGPGVSRPGFNAVIRACRKGDTLIVWKLDRLGRSLLEVLQTCETLEKKGARLHVLTENIDPSSVMGRFMLHLLAALAEMERGLIVERTKAGLEAARARGRIGGRERVVTPAMERRAIKMLRAGEPVSVVAKALGVSKSLITQRRRGEWAPRITAVEVEEDDEAE